LTVVESADVRVCGTGGSSVVGNDIGSRCGTSSAAECIENASAVSRVNGRRQWVGCSLPCGGINGRARHSLGSVSVCAQCGSSWIDFSKSVLVVVEIQFVDGGRIVVEIDLDQSVVVVFLRIFVNESTREDAGHVGSKQGINFGEESGFNNVASILGEENSDGPVGE